MIQSFKSKPLKLLFEKGDSSKIRPDLLRKIENVLSRLHAANEIRDMMLPESKYVLKSESKDASKMENKDA